MLSEVHQTSCGAVLASLPLRFLIGSLSSYFSPVFGFPILAASESSAAAVKAQNVGPTLGVPESVGLRWGLEICNSNTVPGDAGTTILRTTLRAPLF